MKRLQRIVNSSILLKTRNTPTLVMLLRTALKLRTTKGNK